MSVGLALDGVAAEAAARIVPQLVTDLVASRIFGQDATLWGPEAEPEASIRLGWTEAVLLSRPLVPDILALRERLHGLGVHRIVLCGMGGSSLAPEVITRTYGVPLTILDSTAPAQVSAALTDLAETAVVVASKSGSTLETDSQQRAFEAAFREAGIDPIDRIIIVTDPDSPLDRAARAAGYRVFNADPNVGGRYSALTAFGIVPSGLAGAPIEELLDEAESVMPRLAVDTADNPGLVLGAAIAGTGRDKLGFVAAGTHIVGFGDWAEQLIAESTGKLGKGLLPVVLEGGAPDLAVPDLLPILLVGPDGTDEPGRAAGIRVRGTLGALLLTWEVATAVAGRILGINPFDQPDVESAKAAARAFIDDLTPPPAGVALVHAGPRLADLLAQVPADGYVAVQAYLDRTRLGELTSIRRLLAQRSGRPVTFGWGPRFLHSTGQYHKGGPAQGVFLQLVAAPTEDLPIPERPFTFGQLIRAQAAGDAAVLREHGRPVLTVEIDPADLDAVLALAAG